MNTLFAASLFDSPLLLALIVIGGAIANWLAMKNGCFVSSMISTSLLSGVRPAKVKSAFWNFSR